MHKSQSILTTPDQLQTNGGSGGGGTGHFNDDANSESYSSTSSFSESYSDSSDLANWEEYVAENGSLFYAEYSLSSRRSHVEKRIEFSRNSSLRLGKKTAATATAFAARNQQSQTQQTKENSKSTTAAAAHLEEPKFAHIRLRRGAGPEQRQQQQKHLELVITAADRYRFGRRSTAVESILGFRVVPFVDQPECLMVDSFVHDMPAMQQQQQQQHHQQQQRQSQSPPSIKRGDWFKSLDDIDVRTSNVDELLLQFVEPTKVCLKFQGPALEGHIEGADGGTAADSLLANDGGAAVGGSRGGNASDLRKIENFANFAIVFEQLQLLSSETATISTTTTTSGTQALGTTSTTSTTKQQTPFLLLILPPECYQNERHKDSLFFYPEPAADNFLYKSRGSFLTLNAVLGSEMQTKPLSSQFTVDQEQYHVCYRSLNSFLVLFAYAATSQSMLESNLRTDELIGYMRFALPTLSLAHLASDNETSAALRSFLQHFCTIQRARILKRQQRRCLSNSNNSNITNFANVTIQNCHFEDLLQQSRSLPLPKEAQLRIFDALSEMEAMDYRNWNDEPLNTHREFFIHGSVLYYDNFLLAAQLPLEMRACVESFLRCRGIFDFVTEHCVKELYVWEEIVPLDLGENGDGGGGGGGECGRFFLTICSRSHLILAVILKIFDAPDLAINAVIPPSLFYIEEIQETLDHLISCGIESLAIFWSISNKRPEVLDTIEAFGVGGGTDDPNATHDGKDGNNKLEAFIKQKLSSASNASQSATQSQRSISYDEETHMCSSLGGSSIHSLNQSEDDSSRKRLTTTTTTTSNNNNNDNVSDSGSDWDNFGEQNPLQFGGIDAEQLQSQMTESLWKEINNVVPAKISAGWKNSIFFYVYIDGANGTVFCPLKPQSNNNINSSSNNNKNLNDCSKFLSEIRKACLIIHNVLQQTKNFRRQLAQEPPERTQAAAAAAMTPQATAAAQTSSRIIGLAIKEHGLTIQIRENCTNSKTCENDNHACELFRGTFVIAGRLFQTPTREIYVCHRPDVPQNMVELAFRLSFFSVG